MGLQGYIGMALSEVSLCVISRTSWRSGYDKCAATKSTCSRRSFLHDAVFCCLLASFLLGVCLPEYPQGTLNPSPCWSMPAYSKGQEIGLR